MAALLSGRLLSNHAQGYPWLQALRVGYELSLIGVLVFMLGGVEDMIWHILFGLKINIEVLYSPTHVLMVLGAGLIVTGPWRAAWRRQEALAAAITSARLLVYPGVGHAVYWEEPARVASDLVAFIEDRGN